MALSVKERAAQIMEHLVTHNSHGYSQYSRLGDGGSETITLSDGTQVTIATGDRDCSSAVVDAYRSAGVDCGSASYTGNMRYYMVGSGNFTWHPMSSGYIAQRGDIYLNETHHTAMCTSAAPDMLAQFSSSENGTIDGQEGDQTGYESSIKPYYDYPWDGILEYVGPEFEGEDMALTDSDIDRIAERFWQYHWNGDPSARNAYDKVRYLEEGRTWDDTTHFSPIGDLVASQPISYGEGDDLSTASLGDRIAYIDLHTHVIDVQLSALTEAVKTLATSKGADPDEIAKAVGDAVAKKLESIDLEVKVGE